MAKKILTLGVMVIMALGLFAGCGGNKGISFSIGDVGGFSTEALDEHPIVTKLIKSEDDLRRFCDESGIIYAGEKYNESYFNEKAIIIYSFVNESSMIDIHIDNLKVDNRILTINITRRVPRGGYIDEVQDRFYLFEVSQSDIADVNEIQISHKDKNK